MHFVSEKNMSSKKLRENLNSGFERTDDSMAIVGNKFLTDEQEPKQSQGRISRPSSRKQHGHFNSTIGSENEDDSSTTIGCSVVRDLQPIDPIITITGKPSDTEAKIHNPQKILELEIENSSKIRR